MARGSLTFAARNLQGLLHETLPSAPAPALPTPGLLSTEAGTLGRFAGNALLALAGRLTGLDDRSQLAAFCAVLFATLALVCAALLAHLLCTYRHLKG